MADIWSSFSNQERAKRRKYKYSKLWESQEKNKPKELIAIPRAEWEKIKKMRVTRCVCLICGKELNEDVRQVCSLECSKQLAEIEQQCRNGNKNIYIEKKLIERIVKEIRS